MISSKTNWLPYCVIVAFSDFSAMSPNVSGTFHYLVRRGDNKKQHYRLQVMYKMDCDYLKGSELQKKTTGFILKHNSHGRNAYPKSRCSKENK